MTGEHVTPEYLTAQGLSRTFPDRFWSKVDVRGPDECWLWKASLTTGGYGQISRGQERLRPLSANRAAWLLCKGPIPEGLEVCHQCPSGPNKLCVNPAHLRLDDHAGNMADESGETWKRKHPNPVKSEDVGKLSWEQVNEIRRRYTGKRGEQSALAREFRVRQGTIWYIVNHVTWAA
jgi:hypothetical protein